MKMGNKRIILIGLDGGTLDLINPLVMEGYLPNFKGLIEEGASGRLDSAPNQRSAAAWTSFITGKNPGKHGIYEFYDYIPDSYDIRFINSSARDGKSLWRILGESGKKVCVINVPMTYPAEKVEGILISGLDAPGPESVGFSYPSSIISELEYLFGKYIIEPGLTGFIVGNKIDLAVKKLHEEIEQKMAISRHLMAKERWDFFMVVFRSLDAAQHCFWQYMDKTHPRYTEHEARKYGDIIFETYKRVDNFLGEIIAGMDHDTTIMIMSDHGFGQKHPATNQINLWLESKGLLGYVRRKKEGLFFSLLKRAYKIIIGKLPRWCKEYLARRFPAIRDKVQTKLCFSGIDWSNTYAYSDSLFPNIRINLKGREGMGIVNNEEHERLIERIKKELFECRDSKTDEKIVAQVLRRDEIYNGKYLGKAPDLLIRWREDIVINGIKIDGQEQTGNQQLVSVPGEDFNLISGDHKFHGIFFAMGKDVRRGYKINEAAIIDLAPTILYLLDTHIPSDMDGKVLREIFADEILKKKRPSYDNKIDQDKNNSSTTDGYDEADTEKVYERLKGLGYI